MEYSKKWRHMYFFVRVRVALFVLRDRDPILFFFIPQCLSPPRCVSCSWFQLDGSSNASSSLF